ncbi:MAG TPA: FAD-dependent oxidoreductase [Thermoanaerobaculia bacterium]|jgi:phytoene dehydrogenase-like protein
MTFSNALVRPGVPRPAAVTPIKGLYLAGDWVGEEGILSDAVLASARAAAKAILAG